MWGGYGGLWGAPYGWAADWLVVAAPTGAYMPLFQRSNLGADLFNGTIS